MACMSDYEKLRVVGKGSYGEVWLVKHCKDRKQYVLKKMELVNASKRERKAAELEAKLLSKLKHPNIVSYKDSFETNDGYLYIAMGYCDGGDLYTKLKEQKGHALEEKQVVEWFVQIAMALQYMHERNILHRDLKTQNIFLTKSKIIKVGDLGIAKVLDGHNDMATTLIGTPYYMSPELFSNKPYNHKSDVWALGCCVYEMATLKHAFNAKDMNSLVYKILRGKMPAMPRIYSTDLTDLIKAMLHQTPEKRPSVSRILRNPFIKKHIAIFLEGTRQRRPSSTSAERRPSSGSGDRVRPSSARSDIYEIPAEQKAEINKPSEPGDEKMTEDPLAAIPEVSSTKEREAAKTPSPRNTPKDQGPVVEKSKQNTPKVNIPKVSQPRAPPAKTDQPRPAVEPRKDGSKVAVAKRKARSAREPSGKSSSVSSFPVERVNFTCVCLFQPSSANKGRPLPPPPSKGETPTKSSSTAAKKKSDYFNKDRVTSSSSSVSSSKEDLNTPSSSTPTDQMRKSANSSARARRRLRESQEKGRTPTNLPGGDYSEVVVERRRASESATPSSSVDATDGPTPKSSKSAVHRVKSDPQTNTEKKKVTIVENTEIHDKNHSKEDLVIHRQQKPGNTDKNQSHGDSSSSTEEDDSDQKKQEEGEDKQEEKEMKRFSKMLETTLKMEDVTNLIDKDCTDGDTPTEPEPVPSSQPSQPVVMPTPVSKNNRSGGRSGESDKFIEIEAAAPRAPKGIGNMTLTTCGRLMDRIAALRRDIIKGVGIEVLKQAYELLEDTDGNEIEPRLVELMGRDKFDIFAGKIWQLKFCEETVFG
ncbi:uncharacterized protein LOC144440940 [Glandiceps talaboti]